MAKERIIYDNNYSSAKEKDCREFLLEAYGEDEGWQTVDDIPDDRVWQEMAFTDEINWEDESYELRRFFDDGHWILQGSLGLWNGRHRGGYTFSSFGELAHSWDKCDYIKLYDENGHFCIEASHHDGTNCYEVKRLTEKGYEYLDSHTSCNREGVHDTLFNNNFYSALPHYAHKVYGCKKRDGAA